MRLDDYLDKTQPLRRKSRGKFTDAEIQTIKKQTRILARDVQPKDIVKWMESDWAGRATLSFLKRAKDVPPALWGLASLHPHDLDPSMEEFGIEKLTRNFLNELRWYPPSEKTQRALDAKNQYLLGLSLEELRANAKTPTPQYKRLAFKYNRLVAQDKVREKLDRARRLGYQPRIAPLIAQELVERYGSWQRLRDTVNSDPFAVVEDVAIIGAPYLRSTGIPRLMRAANILDRLDPGNVLETIGTVRGLVGRPGSTPQLSRFNDMPLSQRNNLAYSAAAEAIVRSMQGDPTTVQQILGERGLPEQDINRFINYMDETGISNASIQAQAGDTMQDIEQRLRDEVATIDPWEYVPSGTLIVAGDQRFDLAESVIHRRFNQGTAGGSAIANYRWTDLAEIDPRLNRANIEQILRENPDQARHLFDRIDRRILADRDSALPRREEQRSQASDDIRQVLDDAGITYDYSGGYLQRQYLQVRNQYDRFVLYDVGEAGDEIALTWGQMTAIDPRLTRGGMTDIIPNLPDTDGPDGLRHFIQMIGDENSEEVGRILDQIGQPQSSDRGVDPTTGGGGSGVSAATDPDAITDAEFAQRAGTREGVRSIGEENVDLTDEDLNELDQFLEEVQGLMDETSGEIRESGGEYTTDAQPRITLRERIPDELEQRIQQEQANRESWREPLENYPAGHERETARAVRRSVDEMHRRRTIEQYRRLPQGPPRSGIRRPQSSSPPPTRISFTPAQHQWIDNLSDANQQNLNLIPSGTIVAEVEPETIDSIIKALERSGRRTFNYIHEYTDSNGVDQIEIVKFSRDGNRLHMSRGL